MQRSAELADFLERSIAELQTAAQGKAAKAAGRVAMLMHEATGSAKTGQGARLPVCNWFSQAIALATEGPRAGLAAAFASVEPQLTWRRRSSANPAQSQFWDGHANAMILGPGGLEERSDLWIGATIMAPQVTYDDHNHPPEELYLSLTPGEWWNAGMDWTDPGPNGAIYNPPGILHKMRAGKGPFLALWFLPV